MTDVRERPLVVALIGLPGSGKSTLAIALQQRLGLHRICRDQVRAAMFPDCAYTPAEKRAAFRAVLTALEVNCALERSSVLDGMTFSRRVDLEAVDGIVRKYDARPLPVYIDCPLELARERVAADAHSHIARDRSPALVDAVAARFDPPPPGCARIDGRLSWERQVELLMGVVGAYRGGA